MTDVPKGWCETTISEVVELQANGNPFQQGWSPLCESRPAEVGEWGVLKTTAIQHGEFWPHENKALPSALSPRPQIEVKPGDLLMTCAGPRNRCGVACLVTNTPSNLMMSGKMYRFRPDSKILDGKYLSYYIRSHDTQRRIDEMKTGISDSGLNLTHGRFAGLPITIAPINEQRRIVEKIEALFDEIDKGIESLKAAKAALGLYRQSLLKAAFEGRLTAEWRAKNPDKLEDPQTLFARIRKEREARYKSDLAAWQEAVKAWQKNSETGDKPRKPSRPDDTAPIEAREIESMPLLPDSWAYGRLGLYLDWIEAGKSFKCLETEPSHDQVGVAKVSAVSWGEFNEHESKTCLDSDKVNEALFIRQGDFLLSRANTIELVGAAVIAKAVSKRIMLSDKTLRLHFWTQERSFFLHYLRSPYGRSEIESRSTGNQESMRNIGQDRIKSIIIPICGEQEQAEIACILEDRLEAVERLSAEISAATSRAEAMRQSILKQAFAGQLVPQDPADEPASVLLERIQKENASAAPKGKRKVSA